jgi:hypothetical protein
MGFSVKLKTVLSTLITLMISNLTFTPIVQCAPKAQFSIAYTNDVMGEVEPCG